MGRACFFFLHKFKVCEVTWNSKRKCLCSVCFVAVREQERSGWTEELWLYGLTRGLVDLSGCVETLSRAKNVLVDVPWRKEIQDTTELHGCGAQDATLTMKVHCLHLRGNRRSWWLPDGTGCISFMHEVHKMNAWSYIVSDGIFNVRKKASDFDVMKSSGEFISFGRQSNKSSSS
jgi:hypothetical protein